MQHQQRPERLYFARVAAATEDLEQIKVAVNQIVESKESSSLSFLVLLSSDSEESGNDTGDDGDDVDAESNARSDEKSRFSL